MTPLTVVDVRYNGTDLSSSNNSTFTADAAMKKPIAPPSPGRAVSFCTRVKVFRSLHVNDYSPAERANTWLSPAEMREIKYERKLTVKIMEKADSCVNNEERYFRGLESKTREGNKRKQFLVVDSSMCVLDEQSQQHCTGASDPEAIAEAYASCTSSCAKDARLRGLYDEKAAQM